MNTSITTRNLALGLFCYVQASVTQTILPSLACEYTSSYICPYV